MPFFSLLQQLQALIETDSRILQTGDVSNQQVGDNALHKYVGITKNLNIVVFTLFQVSYVL